MLSLEVDRGETLVATQAESDDDQIIEKLRVDGKVRSLPETVLIPADGSSSCRSMQVVPSLRMWGADIEGIQGSIKVLVEPQAQMKKNIHPSVSRAIRL